MLNYYKKTEVELCIEKLYKNAGILSPSDLSLDRLCHVFNIEIQYCEDAQSAIWDNEFAMFFLNPYSSLREQRATFFHELCHPLRHVGDQRRRHPAFQGLIELQEAQARNFQLYAAIPFFMVEQLELPKGDKEIVGLFVQKFYTTYFLAYRRWEQIKRRILQGIFDEKIKFHLEVREKAFTNQKREDDTFFY